MLEEWLPEVLQSTAVSVLSQNQSFPTKFMYLLVYTPQKQLQQLVSAHICDLYNNLAPPSGKFAEHWFYKLMSSIISKNM